MTSTFLIQPIEGIENRTANEVFDIMRSRILSALSHHKPEGGDYYPTQDDLVLAYEARGCREDIAPGDSQSALTACQQEVERLRKDYDAACEEAAKSYSDKCSAEARILELETDLEIANDKVERLRADLSAKSFALRNGKSLAEDSLHAIRDLLRDQNVPEAAFIDDHVANAIVQRNQAEARNAELEAELASANRTATDRAYMMQAYRSMLGPIGLQVAALWEKKGVKRQHTSWGPESRFLSGEERAQALLDVETALKHPLDFDDSLKGQSNE